MSLKKDLGFWGIFSMASGAMISSGLFVLPGIAFKEAGPAIILSYLIAALLMIPTLFSEAELSTAMPKAGGDYFFIDRSLGVVGGTVGGIANWFFISLKTSFALVGIGAFYALINPSVSEFNMRLIGAGVALVFIIINLVSVKFSGKIEVILVVWLLAILSVYVFKGFGASSFEISRFDNFMDKGFSKVLSTAGLVFISFGGITKITSVAEEVKNPTKNLPRGMFGAFIVVTVFYILAVFITIGVMESGLLVNSYAPLSEASIKFMGKFGGTILSIGALLAFITTGNAGILAASRYPIAMSRDEILPKVFSKVSKRFGTPYISVLGTGLFIMLAIICLDIKSLVKAASTLMIVSFIFVNLSLIVMRESKLSSYRPKVKTPFYPFVQIIGIIAYLVLILEMGFMSIAISLTFIFLTLCWYFIYVKKRVSRESALMYMVKKITAKEFINTDLDDELKDILLERDNIVEDRFDKLIHNSEMLDLETEGIIELEEFLEIISIKLGKRINCDKDKVYQLLMAREKESPTVIKEGLAIPHIVIDGKNQFDILVVRCKNGINFKLEGKIVKTVFVLAGSQDERNFHLKALMSIAQIVSDEHFDEKWMQAKNVNELRNIILLSNRKRG